ncbi:MAG TPA: DUF4236 domain-containing protein [Armatimonadota bacterium]|nr:DUF4236 domain-containing protein [Armatimonadota bacterium]
MGWRFRRSISLGKGVRLNLSKSGVGISAGVKGFRVGMGPRGTYSSMGIPGTGLYNIQYYGTKNASHTSPHTAAANIVQKESVPGDTAIGFGIAIGILGILTVFASPYFGLSCLSIAVALCFIGVNNPQREVVQKRNTALQKVGMALEEYKAGRYASALRYFQEAKSLNPADITVYAIIGHIYAIQNKYQEALPYLEYAKNHGVTDESFDFLLGTTYASLGEYQKAIRLFQSIPETSENHIQSLIQQASAYEKMGDIEAAIASLEQAPLAKRNLDDDLKMVHYNLGVYYIKLGDKKKSIATLTTSVYTRCVV